MLNSTPFFLQSKNLRRIETSTLIVIHLLKTSNKKRVKIWFDKERERGGGRGPFRKKGKKENLKIAKIIIYKLIF